MKIKTQFDVNHLVKHKFDVVENEDTVLEVLQIESISCLGGTSIFYYCRSILITRSASDIHSFNVRHAIRGPHQSAYEKYREDELIDAPKELVDLIIGIKEK